MNEMKMGVLLLMSNPVLFFGFLCLCFLLLFSIVFFLFSLPDTVKKIKKNRQTKRDAMLTELEGHSFEEFKAVLSKLGVIEGEYFDFRRAAGLFSPKPLASALCSWISFRESARQEANKEEYYQRIAERIVIILGVDGAVIFLNRLNDENRHKPVAQRLGSSLGRCINEARKPERKKDGSRIIRQGLKACRLKKSEIKEIIN